MMYSSRGGADFERSLSGYRRVKPATSEEPRLGSPFSSYQATRVRANAKPGQFGRSAAAGELRRWSPNGAKFAFSPFSRRSATLVLAIGRGLGCLHKSF
jgi:hypothetical protein